MLSYSAVTYSCAPNRRYPSNWYCGAIEYACTSPISPPPPLQRSYIHPSIVQSHEGDYFSTHPGWWLKNKMAQIIADKFSCNFNFLRAVVTSERFSPNKRRTTHYYIIINVGPVVVPSPVLRFVSWWGIVSFDSSESIIVYCVYSPLNHSVYTYYCTLSLYAALPPDHTVL